MLNSKLSFEEQRRQDVLDGRLPKTSNKNARPRQGSDPAPAQPYDPALNSSLRRADTTVLGSKPNAVLAPMSPYERELAKQGKVPQPYQMSGDPGWKYNNADPMNMPEIRTGGAPVMLPQNRQSGTAVAINNAARWALSPLSSLEPAPPVAPPATGGMNLYQRESAAAPPPAPATRAPAPPAPSGPLQPRPDPFGLWARPNDPLGIQSRPTAQTPVMANGGPSGASPQQVVGTPDLSPDRLVGERKALMRRHDDVMRQLRMLGPSFGGRPENEALRLSLINQRRDLEDRIGTLGRAMGPGPVVSPSDAEAGRARLMRTTGVDVRPEREKALAYAIALSNADPRGAGPSSPAGLEALDTNRPFEEADFAKRQAARDARTDQARRELTTPLPGGEAPLSQYERMRRQEMLDTGRSAELATAQHEAGIRTLGQVGRPDPMDAAKIGLISAQTKEIAARAGVSEAQAQQIIDELRNPDSARNKMKNAEEEDAKRKAAALASGTAPGATTPMAGALVDKIGGRFFEKSGWLTRMMNRTGFPIERSDVGANFFDGQTMQDDLADLDTLDTMVVRRLEQLAHAGDTLNASQDAAAVLSRLPRPQNGTDYTTNFAPATPFVQKLNGLRSRLMALAGTK